MLGLRLVSMKISSAVVWTVCCLASGFPVLGQETCGFGHQAHPVPKTRPGMAPGEYLWPHTDAGAFTFRPASDGNGNPYAIPADRDSTEYKALGSQVPNAFFGMELFTDVARLDGNDDWLFTAYNVGLQVWDLRIDPARPIRAVYRDGWLGDFLEMPPPGEVDVYVESIDVTESADRIFVGLGGRSGHGFSLWEFDPPNLLTPHCQRSDLVARQVEMIEHQGQAYAFVGTTDGLFVFDVSGSLGGAECALLGRVGDQTDGAYVSVLQTDDRVFAAVADGSILVSDPLKVSIWEVDPQAPADARELFSGFSSNSRGPALFSIAGRDFLGLVENSNEIAFYDVSACLDHEGPGPCGSLGPPLAVQEILNIGKLYEFLDISTSDDGRTWAYYGFVTSPGLFGTKFEYLLDVSPLASVTPETAAVTGPLTLSEVTDGGDTYLNSAPCTHTVPIDYWGDYYPLNRFGLSFFTPRHGIFIGDRFYRAALTLLDVHELVGLFSDDFESGGLGAWTVGGDS